MNTNKIDLIKEWISKEQDGLMDANGNFDYPEHDGAYNILCNLDAYIDSLQEEPAPKILEDMLNAKTPAESLGISAEEHDRIVDEIIYGKEPEMVDIDDLHKEEPVSKVWHDASNLPYNSEAIVIEHSEYGTSIVPACKMSRVKGAKWALLEDILKL